MQPKKFFRRKQSKKLRLSLYSWAPNHDAQKLVTIALVSIRTRTVRPSARFQEAR